MILPTLTYLAYLNSTSLVQFTQEVLLRSFQARSCLVYLGESNAILEAALVGAGFAVVRGGMDACSPTGYVLCGGLGHEVRPHVRLLVFQEGTLDYQVFKQGIGERGLDIIVLEHFAGTAIATYLNTGKVVGCLNGTSMDWSPPSDFAPILWKPNSTFTLSTFHCPPYLKYDPVLGFYGGIEKYILDLVVGNWSLKVLNYPLFSYTRVLQDLQDNTSDLVTCAPWQVRLVSRNLGATIPYQSSCATFLVPKPALLPHAGFVFRIFTAPTWSALMASILVQASIHKLFNKAPYQTLLVEAYGGYLQNPTFRPPKSLYLATLLASILASTVYSAGLYTSLEVPKLSPPINTIADLHGRNFHTNEAMENLLVSRSNLQNIKLTQTSDVHLKNLYLINVVKGFVILTDVTTPKWKRRTLKVLHDCFGRYNLVLGLRKDSPYKEVFDRNIERFVEHGLVEIWWRLEMYQDWKELVDMDSYFRDYTPLKVHPLNLELLQGTFYLVLIGTTLAAAVFTFEVALEKQSLQN